MTNAELAILSLIAESPRHGYQIEQVIQERNMRDWTEIGFSSIYYLLNKLETKGFVESQTAPSPGKGPGRKIYHPTAKGIKEFKAAIRQTLSTPVNRYSSFLVGLANLPVLHPEAALSALQTYRNQLIDTNKHIDFRQQNLPHQTPTHVTAMFDLSAALLQAELTWLDSFISHFKKETLSAKGK